PGAGTSRSKHPAAGGRLLQEQRSRETEDRRNGGAEEQRRTWDRRTPARVPSPPLLCYPAPLLCRSPGGGGGFRAGAARLARIGEGTLCVDCAELCRVVAAGLDCSDLPDSARGAARCGIGPAPAPPPP